MITIVDYGVGNIKSFINVYDRLNISVKIAKTCSDLKDAERLILPGVGHFDHAMSELAKSGMREKLDELVLIRKLPVMGVCVGMQIMGNYSEEGDLEGLKWLDASIKKIDETKINQITRLPHMGWNNASPTKHHDLFNGMEDEPLFYFLHSYYFECNDESNILAETKYGNSFTSVASNENIYGIQFHPEKSHVYGEILLKNFSKV
jgi:imidazole glycerol-phosphate synthase subunit HisH